MADVISDIESETQEPDGLETAPPGIPVSAGALIFDRKGRLLILKPTYKSGWTIPGGIMEADGETPWDACRREVREECGIEVHQGRLVCMDFRRPRPGRAGGIRFLFDTGQAGDEDLAGVVLQPEEISEYRLAALPDALGLLRGPIRRRVRAATRSPRLVYLENGRPVPGIRLLAVRDKLGHVVVKLGHRLVECSEPGSVCPCELCQVSIGHLTVTNDSLGGDIGVRDIVGPEFMPRVGGGADEDLSCRAGRLAFADEQPHQAALSDRARREVSAHTDEPVLGGAMVNVILYEEGDEHVRVEENGH